MTLDELLVLHERLCGDWSNPFGEVTSAGKHGIVQVKPSPEGEAWLKDWRFYLVERAMLEREGCDVGKHVRARWRRKGPRPGLLRLLRQIRKEREADEAA